MSEHCGCRGIEPIADLMDEHYEILDIAGDVRRVLAVGDRPGAATKLARMGQRIGEHVGREERGVFAALKSPGEFVQTVTELECEHSDFDELFARLLGSPSRHVDQENQGIFPVASVTLNAAGWEMVTKAHSEPHSRLEGDALAR